MAHWTKLIVIALCSGGAIEQPAGGTKVPPLQAPRFDETASSHHFYLYDDGGAIEITIKERSDKKNLAAIREHLPQMVQLFAKGDVPGTEEMKRLRDRIAYTYEDIQNGGRLRITTRHARALAAVYQYLRSQIQDHKTGDSLEVRKHPISH